MNEHTPTPWSSQGEYMYAADRPLSIASGKQDSAVARGGPCHDDAAANAAFIVRACNNHEALVNALEGALVVLESMPRPTAGLVSNQVQMAFDKRIEAVRSALARTYRQETSLEPNRPSASLKA